MRFFSTYILLLIVLGFLPLGYAAGEDAQEGWLGMPLLADEITIESLSVNDVLARYGKPLRFETAYWTGNCSAYIRLVYVDIVVTLADSQNLLSFAKDTPDGFNFNEKDIQLSDSDKRQTLPVSDFLWSDETIDAPRGARIGDSLQDIKSLFLDESNQHNDGILLYWSEESDACGRYIRFDESNQLTENAYADSYLYYNTGYPESRYACFYFMEDALVAVPTGYSNEP